jgi:ApbE superfamily uncharacterized protein (UPF0280 family)
MNSRGEPRNYRKIFKSDDLAYYTVKVKQTDLCIGATADIRKQAEQSVSKYRQQVEEYIRRQPVFLDSLVPVEPLEGAPEIVRHMCRAAQAAGVGPMAAIAGAVSLYVSFDLAPLSAELVIENGGDIYLAGKKERIAGIYAGESPLSNKIGLRLPPQELPMAVCTSSGTVGHSLSFGLADAAVILSKDACLADAAATAMGNLVRTPEDIEPALQKVQAIKGISGALIIVGSSMGAWGGIDLVKL